MRPPQGPLALALLPGAGSTLGLAAATWGQAGGRPGSSACGRAQRGHSRVPMVLCRNGWMYLGMTQNTWTTAAETACQAGRRAGPASAPSTSDLRGPAPSSWPQSLLAVPYHLPYGILGRHPYWPYIHQPLSVPWACLPRKPLHLRAQCRRQGPGSLTTGESTQHQLEGHEHVAQVVGLRYDRHAAVLGVIEDPCALQVGVAELRVAHVSNVQEPVPHAAQGPGWGQLCAGARPETSAHSWGQGHRGSAQSRGGWRSAAWPGCIPGD